VSDPVENKKRKISHSDDGEGGPSGGDGEGGPSGGDGEGGPSGGDGEVGDEAFDKYAGELRRFFKRQTQLLDNKFEDLKVFVREEIRAALQSQDRNEEGPRASHKSDSPSEKVERVTKTVEKVNKRVEKANKRVEKAAEQVQRKSVKKSTKPRKFVPRRSSRLNNTPKKAATGSLPVEVRLQHVPCVNTIEKRFLLCVRTTKYLGMRYIGVYSQEVPGNDGDGEVSAKHTVSDYDMDNIYLGGASSTEQVTHLCNSHVTIFALLYVHKEILLTNCMVLISKEEGGNSEIEEDSSKVTPKCL